MANGKKKSRKKLIIFSSLGLLVVALIVIVLVSGNKEKVIAVQTEKVKRMTLVQVVEANGKINPQTQVKINAEVSGEIIDLPVKEGDRVRKGQLLCRIKPDAYLADRDQAVANLNRAKSALVQRRADLKRIESEFKRQSELHSKGLISDSDFESGKNALDAATSNVESAEYDVQNSQAFLTRQKENLGKTSIYSPIDGIVSQLLSKNGERVSGSSFTQGTEIMTVSDLAVMEARVEVNENDVVLISLNDTARVEVDAFPDRIFTAVVYQIANTANTKAAGTQEEVTNFEVRLLLLDKGVEFRPGMSCSAKIETETKTNVLAVPLQAVTTRDPRKKSEEQPMEEGQEGMASTPKKEERAKPDQVVFLAAGGVARKQVVHTGISSDSFIEVLDGLKEGQEIIKGNYRAVSRDLEDNSKIRIDNSGRSAAPKDEK